MPYFLMLQESLNISGSFFGIASSVCVIFISIFKLNMNANSLLWIYTHIHVKAMWSPFEGV